MSSDVLAGRYRLLDLLGRGGAAEVWRAEDQVLRRRVAVKLLPPASDLLQEAWAAARLSHPNVVVTYDVGAEAGKVFLVMELVDGPDLARSLRSGGLPAVEQVADIAVQASRGLDAAHAAGIVHRDVKPGNLLLAPDGTLKIADFGIAQAGQDPRRAALLGTPAYVSPEQVRGAPATAASDRYALGCVLYELLTGSPPFTGETAEVLRLHRDAAPEPVGRGRPHIAPGLAELVMLLLSKDPDRRPASAGEVIALLEQNRTQVLTLPEPQRRVALPYLRVAAVLAVVLVVVGAVALLRDATSGGAAAPSPIQTPIRPPTTAAKPSKPATPNTADTIAALNRLADLLREGGKSKAGHEAAKNLDRAAVELADGNTENAGAMYRRATWRLARAWQDGRWEPTPQITALMTYLGGALPDTGSDEGDEQ